VSSFYFLQTNNVDRDQVKAAIKAQQDQQIENVSNYLLFSSELLPSNFLHKGKSQLTKLRPAPRVALERATWGDTQTLARVAHLFASFRQRSCPPPPLLSPAAAGSGKQRMEAAIDGTGTPFFVWLSTAAAAWWWWLRSVPFPLACGNAGGVGRSDPTVDG
jgi:hypothetical protein